MNLTKKYKQKEIDELAQEIRNMGHEKMARLWRHSPAGSKYFRNDLVTSEGEQISKIFEDRFLNHFGGFNPKLSKKIGW